VTLDPGPGELRLLYVDDHVVAVDKPAWWVVHRTRGARDAPCVIQTLSEQLNQTLYPVHRLDRQASGILLLARSSVVAGLLSEEIRDSRWDKQYLALCRGVMPDSLRIDHPMRATSPGGPRRDAVTTVDPLQTYCDRYTLVRAAPRSGRRHQIRYHMKHVVHPLVGDSNYGQGSINRFFRETFGLQRLFLHAERLRLVHPTENRYLELTCPLPRELERVLQQLSEFEGPVP